MCKSMVDIQSVTAKIRRGIKKEERKKRAKNIMFASATQGGHNYYGNRQTSADGARDFRDEVLR